MSASLTLFIYNDTLFLIHKQSTTAVLNQVDIPRACTGILIHIVLEFVLTGMGNRSFHILGNILIIASSFRKKTCTVLFGKALKCSSMR